MLTKTDSYMLSFTIISSYESIAGLKALLSVLRFSLFDFSVLHSVTTSVLISALDFLTALTPVASGLSFSY